jgi:L-glyceraldehyde 3-phosphate reductase
MAIGWILRLSEFTSAVIGASHVEQLEENVRALEQPDFIADELARIDELTTISG